MTTEQEQARAKLLLEYRERGYTIWRHIRFMKAGYIASGTTGVLCIVLFCRFGESWPLWLALGASIGYIARDMNWFHACREVHPFSQKITDWAKVEVIAQGSDPTSGEGTGL